jgi:hypothetical protein
MTNPLDNRIPGDITELDDLVNGVTPEDDDFEKDGEAGLGSSETDLEADDDVSEFARQVGIGTDDDDEVRPLNIARDVEIAEKIHRNK